MSLLLQEKINLLQGFVRLHVMSKGMEFMRTREEQIAELSGLCEDAGILAPGAAHERAEEILSEAEQRVRAEIGRDSERLDWLEGQISINHACEALRTCRCGTASYTIDEWKCAKHGSLRAAIDAAREVG